MALQGTLDTFALPDVLHLLAATKKTGRLRLSGGRGSGAVWLEAGSVVSVDVAHAPAAGELADALFELLRFEDGSFSFDVDVVHEDPAPAADVDSLLDAAGSLLEEWRSIAAVVPSLDAWVSLRPRLDGAEVVIDRDRWTTLVAVGTGATVRRVGEELGLAELPVSRAVKDLVELGVADVDDAPPAGVPTAAAPPAATTLPAAPAVPAAGPAPEPELRPEPLVADFAPAPPAPNGTETDLVADAHHLDAPWPAASSTADLGSEDLDAQLANLSPRAAEAVRAAAAATTEAEREAALSEAESAADSDDVNRGLLLKFLSSVKT